MNRTKRKRVRIGTLICHFLLIAGGLIMLYPILFILLSSFFTPEEFDAAGVGLFPIAKAPTLDNIKALFFVSGDSYTLLCYGNSLLRTLYGTFWSCLTSLLAGYVFAVLRFKGKNVLFMIMLSTQMVPSIVGTLPMYVELNVLGLYNTMGTYLFINGGLVNVMGTFLVKQAIEGIPPDLINAAKIDGARTYHIIFIIIFPLIKAIMAYIAITGAIGLWNDWQVPFYYTDSKKLQTVASALTELTSFAGQEGSMINYPAILTFSLMLTVPCIIIFAIFQKWIVEGIAVAGVKG